MIVLDFDVVRTGFSPGEGDAPLLIDAHGVLFGPIAGKRM
jgi:hypothetical protein